MKWKQGRRSDNVSDHRGQRGSSTPRRVPRGATTGGGAIILIVLAVLFFGQDPEQMVDMLSSGSDTATPASPPATSGPPQDELGAFVAVILADTEDTWERLFSAAGERYQAARLVLYEDVQQTACGLGQAATGPFYCPGDQTIYLDLSFLRELQRLGAPGDFALAYVIAHEVGHHIQRITGTEQEVRRLQNRSSQSDANKLSVLMELQADCYAGIWAHHVDNQGNIQLETGDIDEGFAAAAAVGDDRLQRAAGRRVQPEAFTHGSSKQRVQWFRTGLQAGEYSSCDTFAQAR